MTQLVAKWLAGWLGGGGDRGGWGEEGVTWGQTVQNFEPEAFKRRVTCSSAGSMPRKALPKAADLRQTCLDVRAMMPWGVSGLSHGSHAADAADAAYAANAAAMAGRAHTSHAGATTRPLPDAADAWMASHATLPDAADAWHADLSALRPWPSVRWGVVCSPARAFSASAGQVR